MDATVQQILAMPRIGENAPEFKALATQGNITFPADYKGNANVEA